MSMSKHVPSFRLDGEVAFVTGGGSGLGRAVCLTFAEAGASVVVVDIDESRAQAVADEIGAKALALQANVTDEKSVNSAVERAVDRFGRVDVLFNNAGINRRAPTTDLELGDWNSVLAVNTTGMFITAKAVARIMKAKGTRGRIINTASVLGMSGGFYPNIAYQASKGAVVNMTRSWAIEWAEFGIRVNAIAPGMVRTPFTENITTQPELVKKLEALTPMRRLGETDDITGPVLFLATAASSFVTGHILPIDGGMLAQ